MKLGTRFTVYFSLTLIVVLGLFASAVYWQVRSNLLLSADRALLAHLEHDSEHLGHSHDTVHAQSSPRAEQVYLEVRENGVLLEDSFPPGESPDGKNGISKRIQVKREGRVFDVLGFYDLRPIQSYLFTLRRGLILGLLAALLLIVPIGLVSTAVLLAPFRALARRTSELDVRSLSFRFPEPKVKDEYGTLILNFNQLLARLDSSFLLAKRFAAHASHELRTPLAVIVGQAEMVLRRPRTLEEHREVASKILSQAYYLREITNHLLNAADLERAENAEGESEVPVTETLDQILSTLQDAYRSNRKGIVFRNRDPELRFPAKESLLRSAMANLVENALKYSNEKVEVELRPSDGKLELIIEDDGPGIPSHLRDGILEGRSVPHSKPDAPISSHGLGLFLVKAYVDSCRGNIEFGESSLGGLLVRVVLPKAASVLG